MNLNRIKLIALAACALFVGGLRDQFCTANVNDKGTEPNDPNVERLCKGAGVDPKDVYWRVRAGLTASQAVDVAAQEKLEREKKEQFHKSLAGKRATELRKIAKQLGAFEPEMSKAELIEAIKETDRFLPLEATPSIATEPAAADPAAAPKPLSEMSMAELKAEAASRTIDITGLKSKKAVQAAIESAAGSAK